MMRYFEDFAEGQVYDLGELRVSEPEIVEFARKYDPQAFHVDPEAAQRSIFGGLIASGWHTGSMYMGLLVRVPLRARPAFARPAVRGDNLPHRSRRARQRWRAPQAGSACPHRRRTPMLPSQEAGPIRRLAPKRSAGARPRAPHRARRPPPKATAPAASTCRPPG